MIPLNNLIGRTAPSFSSFKVPPRITFIMLLISKTIILKFSNYDFYPEVKSLITNSQLTSAKIMTLYLNKRNVQR